MQSATLENVQIDYSLFESNVQPEWQYESDTSLKRSRVIVIAGPTAVGKSSLAVMLAKTLGGEVISADSVQVYRDMDIGTAKASSKQQKEVPHHLIDIRDLHEEFNVVDFYYEARLRCQEILARNRVPIIAGGSGFYLHALLYGPPSGPPSVPQVRQAIEKRLEIEGAEGLYERLQQMDPIYAQTITVNDRQKIVRGLEIIQLTGKKVSSLVWNKQADPQTYDFRCWFLHKSREVTYQRINERCDEMMEMDFLNEVRGLKIRDIEENRSASQAIGYRQALAFLASQQTEEDYQKFLIDFKRATRKYAKRQLTWFRSEPLFRWLDVELHDEETALDIITADYSSLA